MTRADGEMWVEVIPGTDVKGTYYWFELWAMIGGRQAQIIEGNRKYRSESAAERAGLSRLTTPEAQRRLAQERWLAGKREKKPRAVVGSAGFGEQDRP